MASSLLALLDDIATLLDDVSVMTKVAAKRTAGVLGDDLALNAKQVSGVDPDRELPVVWAVAKGSLVNKAILVPAALVLSQFAPWLVIPLMIAGGAYLCYEGVEKIAHKWLHKAEDEAHHKELTNALVNPEVDLVQFEKDKIKGAIRTDFILSAEIIVISLGTIAQASLAQRIGVLVAISLVMTVGVYGFVAGIVKIDDAGLNLSRRASRAAQALGRALLWVAPWLMKTLSVLGTAAMFLVGGGIVTHSIAALHHFIEGLAAPGFGGTVVGIVADLVVGLLIGIFVLGVVELFKRVRKRKPAVAAS
jgi:predicted DNA repair protein MutK